LYRRLIEIGDYYEDRQIKVTTRLTEISEFEDFIGKEVQQDLWPCLWGRNPCWTGSFPGIGPDVL